jgi:hypothetical protein
MTEANIKSARILVNSLPKSGTHLLTKAVELFGYHDFAENVKGLTPKTPINFDYREVKKALKNPSLDADGAICIGSLSPLYVRPSIFRQWLKPVESKAYIVGHLSYSPLLSPLLTDLNYHHFFIIRDPRAVLPSLLSFILNPQGIPKKHFLEADLKQMSSAQRLDFILEGGYAPKANATIKSFANVYREMLKWQQEPRCLMIRFEELVGEQGGGSNEKQQQVVKKMADYLKLPFNDTIVDNLNTLYNPASPTFRIGRVDSWKSSLKAETIKRLTTYCKPLCQEAGYENEHYS